MATAPATTHTPEGDDAGGLFIRVKELQAAGVEFSEAAASPSITLTTYPHAIPDAQQAAAEAIDAALAGRLTSLKTSRGETARPARPHS